MNANKMLNLTRKTRKILVIDNYDSFTYNLVQYLQELKAKVFVFRNDRVTQAAVEKIQPDKIVVSPGPGRPEDAGFSNEIIRRFGSRVPVLGVCLGLQCIAVVFGGKIVNAGRLMHGKTSMINHDGRTIFRGLPNPFKANRYHSLLMSKEKVPDCIRISAWTEKGEIMGIRHRKYPVEGVQFHPESILTGQGKRLLSNFLKIHD